MTWTIVVGHPGLLSPKSPRISVANPGRVSLRSGLLVFSRICTVYLGGVPNERKVLNRQDVIRRVRPQYVVPRWAFAVLGVVAKAATIGSVGPVDGGGL
jgi:hypothetical protein